MARPASTTARRYAEAIFEIALRDDTVEQWLEQFGRMSDVLGDADIVRRLEDPQVPLVDRTAALDGALGDLLPPMANLLGLLLRRRRLGSLPAIARQFRRLHNRREGIVEATATSAAALGSAEVAAMRERLEQITGGTVELDLRVDPELLGGVQVRLGDLLIDGSVRGRLERLRSRLVAGSLTS